MTEQFVSLCFYKTLRVSTNVVLKCIFLSLQIACILTFTYTIYLTYLVKSMKLWRIFHKSQERTGEIRHLPALN